MSDGIKGYLDENLNPVFCFTDFIPYNVDRFIRHTGEDHESRVDLCNLHEERPDKHHCLQYLKTKHTVPTRKHKKVEDENGEMKEVIVIEEVPARHIPLCIYKGSISLGRDREVTDFSAPQCTGRRYNNRSGRSINVERPEEDEEGNELGFSMFHEISDKWLHRVCDDDIDL